MFWNEMIPASDARIGFIGGKSRVACNVNARIACTNYQNSFSLELFGRMIINGMDDFAGELSVLHLILGTEDMFDVERHFIFTLTICEGYKNTIGELTTKPG